ncbi:hypothetical protein GCM10029964_032330 [Kibdelosporangium lantanae]
MPHAAEELGVVGLEPHAWAPAEPEPPAGELPGQILGRDLHAGHHALKDGDQGGPV